MITVDGKKFTISYAIAICSVTFPKVKPNDLLERVVKLYDGWTFESIESMLRVFGERVADGASEIDMSGFQRQKQVFAQFKNVVVGTVGPFNVVKLAPKTGTKAEGLLAEADMLQQLRDSGLRTVPVYRNIASPEQREEIYERYIQGNFIDSKLRFNNCVAVNVVASLYGVEGVNKEADLPKRVEEAVEKKMATNFIPPERSIDNAIEDFKKILVYLKDSYIADLQGILEFGTGCFYIIDPLKIGPASEALASEKEIVQFVKDIIGHLEQLKNMAATQRKEQAKLAQTVTTATTSTTSTSSTMTTSKTLSRTASSFKK